MGNNIDKACHVLQGISPRNTFCFGKWRQLSEVQIRKKAIMSVLSPQTRVTNLRNLEYTDDLNELATNYSPKRTAEILRKYNIRFPNSKVHRVKSVCETNWIELLNSICQLSGSSLINEREARLFLKSKVLGLGFKTTSDLLKDLGFSKYLAVLDSRNLSFLKQQKLAPIELEASRLGSKEIYYAFEDIENQIALCLGISVSELDERIMVYTGGNLELPHRF